MAHTTQDSFAKFQRINLALNLDSPCSDGDVLMTTEGQASRLVIAIDFGTTFSSVAYARIGENTPREALRLADVNCITRYPDDRRPPGVTFAWEPREDVPTELWYKLRPSVEQSQHGDISMQGPEDGLEDDAASTSDSGSRYSFLYSDDEIEPEKEKEHREEQKKRSDYLYWGFGVQKELRMVDVPKDGTKRLTRFKLMLDEKSPQTDHIRTEIATTLKSLKRSRLIKQDADVISDYLQQLLKHTKDELQKSHGYIGNVPIEFVLCVPAVWPSKACRTMQAALGIAAQRSELGSLVDSSIDNLFIISEPEAAAACVLEEEDSHEIFENETIVILDAGGGTVDAITYRITNSHPLRLSAEIVPPGTKLCGASYINERYGRFLLEKLKPEKYLVKNGKTIESIVEAKVIEFENGEKRSINTMDENFDVEPVYIDDLKPNIRRGLHQNRLMITRTEMRRIFKKSLDGAAEVLMEQLEMAKAKGYSVQKVILIGGFGQSPSLQSHLRGILAKERNILDQEINFLTPRVPSTVVARGAVLRAFNKDHGPTRITSCSYGFLRSEPYQPTQIPAHKNARCIIDKADGEKYIDSTIEWLIQKGQSLPSNYEIAIDVKQTFALHRKKFLCKEELYVSDHLHESHYRKTHAVNKGAEFAGSIAADFTFLKDERIIEPQPPTEFSTFSGPRAANHWVVEFELVMIVDGRNLRYEARWPRSSDVEASAQGQSVQASGQVCIAAAFKPGTA